MHRHTALSGSCNTCPVDVRTHVMPLNLSHSSAMEIDDEYGTACTNVSLEQAVEFEVSVTLNSCDTDFPVE